MVISVSHSDLGNKRTMQVGPGIVFNSWLLAPLFKRSIKLPNNS